MVLHGFADGFVVSLIRGEFKLHAGHETSSIKCDRWLVFMFFRCEKYCSHAFVAPNIVFQAILTRCSVWYVTWSEFSVLTISRSACWNLFQLCLLSCKSFYIFMQWLKLIYPHVWGLQGSSLELKTSEGDNWDATQGSGVNCTFMWMGDELKKTSVLAKFSKVHFKWLQEIVRESC